MKYEKEYLNTRTKKEFVSLVIRRYKKIKKTTAIRRFYDMKKKFGVQNPKYELYEKERPNILKMIQIDDMKRLNFAINRITLKKYGFSELEINWLEDEGWFT